MALSGTFAADFSAFVKESEKATVALTDMQAAGVKVETSVNKSFTSMTANAAKSTTATTTLGTTSTNTFTTMANELRTVDQSMAAFGLNINPVVHVMTELGQASGKTATDLGTLGTASAVAAAAFAGWNLGRWIADITGADAAIADFASTLMGTGSAAAETYGAKLDLIQLAIRRGYEGIPSFDQALKYNTEWVKQNAEQYNTATNRVGGWTAELAKAKGGLPALTAEIESGNSTVQEMATHFGVSTRAIEYQTRVIREQAEALKAQEAAQKKAAAEAQAHADAMQRLQDSMFGYDAIAKAQQYLEALVNIENVTQMSTAAQAQMHATLGEAIDAYTRLGVVAPQAMRDIYTATLPLPKITEGLGAAWDNVGEKVNVNADAIIADMQRMTAEAKAYEAETQRMADEWNGMTPPIEAAKQKVDETTGAVGRLSVQMQDLGRVNQSVWESLVAGHQLMEAYREAGVATGQQIATGGYTFAQQRAVGVIPTSGAVGNTLNVNVNNADAQGIASKLVTEMRHQGVRF